ncbi:metal-dependent hydrolase [Parerythrobacter lacustris]|uniref:Metal-dependent hydrolase n=1 Tax=Parerythrobacter lacustris TaxID=2969984 RepID=A0ABT1XPQ9_9SPHN|nr:metal-dependent hydrolase [Parerythrobacter lacustris]MCR2833649.1 metal-dependent hydrolase [Parerythrobacter lacustris]
MDNLTHSLVGALIGQAGLKRKTGLAMPALIIGANLPDIDAACFFWLEGLEHLGFRRGITHGPPALVLLPLILAGLLWGFDRWQAKRGTRPESRLPVSFKWLFLLSFIGCLTHPALDWLNVYGIRLLEPFSSQWFYGDTLFIIDVWLWALMGFATWFSLRREKRGGEWMKPARVALVVSLAYIGANGAISKLAQLTGPQVSGFRTIQSPLPLASWHRETLTQKADGQWWIGRDLVGHCSLDPVRQLTLRSSELSSELNAFLFWSRAPFAERAPDGSVILRDARFYDPRARDRFSLALPEVKCEPLDGPSP